MGSHFIFVSIQEINLAASCSLVCCILKTFNLVEVNIVGYYFTLTLCSSSNNHHHSPISNFSIRVVKLIRIEFGCYFVSTLLSVYYVSW